MLLNYVNSALREARYEILTDDKTYYGEIPGFEGIIANADTLEDCRKQLKEVLEEWILLRVSKNLPLLEINGVTLKVTDVA